MRRSGAPSRQGTAKRFCCPYKTISSESSNSQITSLCSKIHPTNGNFSAQTKHEQSETKNENNKVVKKETAVRTSLPLTPKENIVKFQHPKTNTVASTTSLSCSQDICSKVASKKYFSVVWCKLSKKKIIYQFHVKIYLYCLKCKGSTCGNAKTAFILYKNHKKWEGDAILRVNGRSVVLFDMESKEIGKGSGYKIADLENLKQDETLVVGGKQIEVMSMITEEQFTSGTCFSRGIQIVNCENSFISEVKKPYSDPQKKSTGGSFISHKQESVICQSSPRHDPSAPGALIMPKPNSSHQWTYNKLKLQIVDVVVDPYLSCHLRPHQREGVVFLYECIMGMRLNSAHGAILADDMGLGKTLQCISVLWTLLKQGPYGGKPVLKKVLIITPGSLVKNWIAEFKKWLGTERLKVFGVCSDNRVEEYVRTTIYPVLIISYEMFVRASELLRDSKFDIVVCDEGHRLKNNAIKTTSIIGSLAISRRVVLTGTPIQNDLKEFFSIIDFCNPGVLGSSAAFRRVYEDPIVASRQPGGSQEVITLGEQRRAELTKLTKAFILRRTQDVNNKYLPPKVELVLFCKPSDLQLQLYKRMLQSQLIRSCLSGHVDGSPHLVCIGALKQLCNHPCLIHHKAVRAEDESNKGKENVYSGLDALFPNNYGHEVPDVDDSGKLAVLSSLLRNIHSKDVKEKVVIVSNHTKTLDILEKFCVSCSYQFLRLDGQVPTTQRQDIVNKFNNKYSNHSVFLLSTKAGGVGLNLVAASQLILYDIDWNPANDLQAMARVWRDGQTKKVFIYRLLTTGTIEEKIYQRQISKQGLSGAVIDLKESKDVHFSHEDLKDLFSLNEFTVCDTHFLLNCQCHCKDLDVSSSLQSPTIVRQCQLGDKSSVFKKTNLSMNELLDWHHLSGESPDISPDWCISETRNVSFIFWNEIKS